MDFFKLVAILLVGVSSSPTRKKAYESYNDTHPRETKMTSARHQFPLDLGPEFDLYDHKRQNYRIRPTIIRKLITNSSSPSGIESRHPSENGITMDEALLWRSIDRCSRYGCLDAQTCKHLGCYYDWKTMHCFSSSSAAYSASIEYPANTLKDSRKCENVGGYWLRDSWGWEFDSDSSWFSSNGIKTRHWGFTSGTDYRDEELYRNARHNKHIRFGINTPGRDGNYMIKMFFMENFYAFAGLRSFDVKFYYRTILRNFDLPAESGGIGRPLDYSFSFKVQTGHEEVEGPGHIVRDTFGYLELINTGFGWFILPSALISGVCAIKMFPCTAFCAKPEACNNAVGCIYDHEINHCVSDIRLTKICKSNDGNRNQCEQQNCVFCTVSETCLPPALAHTCPTGCPAFDGQIVKCVMEKCIYDYETGKCIDPTAPDGVDLEKVCGQSNGDPTKCQTAGCVPCKSCVKECLPQHLAFTRCPVGCRIYCGQQSICVQNGCIYDEGSRQCYGQNSTDIDVQKLCSRSNGDVDGCVRRGCHSCKCSKDCVVPIVAANCDPGCLKYCGEVEYCAAAGCVFDYETKKCEGGNGDYRYCFNMCGNTTVDSKGRWFQKWDPLKVRARDGDCAWETNKRTCTCRERQVRARYHPDDVEVWGCVWESNTFTLKFLILEDGLHDLALYFSEIIAFDDRDLTRTLVQFPGLQGNREYPVVNNTLNLKLKHRRKCGNAILTAFCIQKYDSNVNPGAGSTNASTLCTQHNGNEISCKKERCVWCPCSKICVPASLEALCKKGSGCSQYCNNRPECVEHGCVYDYIRSNCHSPNETNVDLPKICSQSDGYSTTCSEQGCQPCQGCKPKCVAPNHNESCPRECSNFCGKPDDCLAEGCLFNPHNQDCIAHNGTVDFGKFCAESKGKKEECRKKGCTYCDCEETRVILYEYCDTGCGQFCNLEDKCAASGCIYNYTTNKCGPVNGEYRYCVNICGNETIDSKGAWYQRYDPKNIRGSGSMCSNFKDIHCECRESGNFGAVAPADLELYRCNANGHLMETDILVLDDGIYELLVHFNEFHYFDLDLKRIFSVSLQGKSIADKLDTSYFADTYVPYTLHQFFSVEGRVGYIRFPGDLNQYPIDSNKLLLKLKHETSCRSAIINGFCLHNQQVCAASNGNSSRCIGQGCVLCNCSTSCVLPTMTDSCPSGCSKYCKQLEPCVNNSCVFDRENENCHDPSAIGGPDLNKVCSQSNGNEMWCKKQGCYFCPCSKTCVSPKSNDTCDSGCQQHCNMSEECAANGCIYNYTTNDCLPSNTGYRYCMNLCGSETVDSQGIWYQKFDQNKITGMKTPGTGCAGSDSNFNCTCADTKISPPVHPNDSALYTCGLESYSMKMSILIAEDGIYELLLRFAEVNPTASFTMERSFDVYFQNRRIIQNFSTSYLPDLYVPYTFRQFFKVEGRVTVMWFPDDKLHRDINNKRLGLQLINRGDGGRAILSGFCIRKYDMDTELPIDPNVNLTTLCTRHNGNKTACTKDHCTWCQCSEVCLPKSMSSGCSSGCSQFCNDVDKCSENMCIYDWETKNCFNETGANVNVTKVCAVSAGNPDKCKRQGCLSCPCYPSLCIPPMQFHLCPSGCTKHCNNLIDCASEPEGCIYDVTTGTCSNQNETLPEVCENTSGNTSDRCTQINCHLCKCTDQCVLPTQKDKCPKGCGQFCGEPESCTANQCVYDETTKACHKPTDPIAETICTENNNNTATCTRVGCKSCPCSGGLCVPPNQEYRCPSGCKQYCGEIERCKENGCIFDWDTEMCSNETETPESVCERSNGDPEKCTRQGCHNCACQKTCVLPSHQEDKCGSGCVVFCEQQENCTSSSCVYNEHDGVCLEPRDPDAIKVCQESSGDKYDKCQRLGCTLCNCSTMCVAPSQIDTCPSGCLQYCGDISKCTSNGCIYNEAEQNCHEPTTPIAEVVCQASHGEPDRCRRIGCFFCEFNQNCLIPSSAGSCPPTGGFCSPPKGEVIIAENMCGPTTKASNNITYKFNPGLGGAISRPKPKCLNRYDLVSGLGADEKLFGSQYLTKKGTIFNIPFKTDGIYVIGLHFAELDVNQRQKSRRITVSLNGIIILDDFDREEFNTLGNPYTATIMFEVADDVTQIRFNNTSSSISNKKIFLEYSYKEGCKSDTCRAMLNGYFIQKC